MNLINKCLFYKRLKQLNLPLEEFKLGKSDCYKTNKLIQTKNGLPVYLIHSALSQDGEVFGGSIDVLTNQGFDGNLKYLVGSDEDKFVKIGDIRHGNLNQGIGTQLLIYLDDIARELDAKKITGWISPVHLRNHGERLLYFYKKNGYQITPEKIPSLSIKGLFATKYL